MRASTAHSSRAQGPRCSIPAVCAALSIGATVLFGFGLPVAGAGAASAPARVTAVVEGHAPGGLSLVVVDGVDAVHISTASLGGELLRATTPAAAGARPAVTRDGDRIVVRNTSGRSTSPPGALDIVVARRVTWSITLNGLARNASVDMRGGSLAALTFADGVAHVSAQLPAATGLERVTLDGGARALTVTAPAGSPAQVVAAAGASDFDLDGSTHPAGVSGGSVFTERGWGRARGRYAIDLMSGISDFAFTRTDRGGPDGI
jgi:hypothetical protein